MTTMTTGTTTKAHDQGTGDTARLLAALMAERYDKRAIMAERVRPRRG